MPRNFSSIIRYDNHAVLAVVVPHLRKDGLYFEINIQGFVRFFMQWSALGRYDLVEEDGVQLPYNLILAVSDMLEHEKLAL